MERTHQLIKLKVETIQSLKRLKTEIALNSLDALINTMIRDTDEHRSFSKIQAGLFRPKNS